MNSLFIIIFIISLIIFLVEINKPELRNKGNRKRKSIIRYFSIGMLLFLILFITSIYNHKIASNLDLKINSLGNVNSIELYKANDVQTIRADYEALTAHQKSLVTKVDILIAAEEKIDKLQIAANKEAADNLAKIRAATATAEAEAAAADVGDNDLLFKWSDYSATQSQNNEYTVYITRTGSKYHRDGCRYLSRSKIAITKSDAISEGYTPCSVCNP